MLARLEGEQITQESKDVIASGLIVPFLRKQTLKNLGECIDSLCDRLVTNADSGEGFGQEINQIAYIGKGIYIEDVRLLKTYSSAAKAKNAKTAESNLPDEMMLQSFL